MWIRALCITGNKPVDNPPLDAEGKRRPQRIEDPPHLFVSIPLQQMEEYYETIKKHSFQVPQPSRLEWVKIRHDRVVQYACRLFREPESRHFGDCFDESTNHHLALWQATTEEKSGPRKANPGAGGSGGGSFGKRNDKRAPKKRLMTKLVPGKKGGRDKSGKAKVKKKTKEWKSNSGGGGTPKRAKALKNGTALCVAWNEGKCNNGDDCPNGKHACNAYTDKSGRVCGMFNHKGKDCTKAIDI